MCARFIKSKHFFEEGMVESLAEVSEANGKVWDEDAELDVVGKGVSRIDGYDKVSGTAKYTFDIKLPNMAHAKILRCPHPHARIKRIDTSKALNLKGVLAIHSHQNTPTIPWFWNMSQLYDAHLRYQGDEVATVVAETERIASEAIKLIEVDYEVLPFVLDPSEAMKDDAPKLYEQGNILRGKPDIYERGDIEKGMAEADMIVEDKFSTQVEVHHPTEVHCSVVNWDGDRLTVYDSTQGIFAVRDTVASSLKIPTSHVRVIKKYMGGGFGSKLDTGKYTVIAALLAREIGRPVRIAMDRKEMNQSVGNRPDSFQHLKIGAKKDGTLTALSHYSIGSSGAYPSGAGCSWPMRSVYQCDNVKTTDFSVLINAGQGRAFRAPGHVQGTFGMESIIDMMAEKIGMDPLEFRLINYAEQDQVSRQPYTSKKLREAYEQGAKAIGWWDRRQKVPGGMPGPLKRGIGMATQIWWGGGGPPAYATMKLNRDGSLDVLAGTQDLGTGTYTFIAQVAAEVLEIPMDQISVIIGDTATCPYCASSGGSTTAPSVAPAVKDAGEQMKEKLLSAAAAIMETSLTNMTYWGGKISLISDPSTSMDISAIMQKMNERILVTTGRRSANPDGYAINTFGAQFAEVEVDIQTGKIHVLRIVAAHDIGRVLNQQMLENQFHGGIIQGLGFALLEERVMDPYTGTLLTMNMCDYKMPTMMDTPQIDVIIVSKSDPLISDVGAKGIGEPAMIPTAAAIANAVYNAIGVRMKSLPITPNKVLDALNA
ncbi:xanthine dehydrogenase family protein molybdopterin-binding subunit [candidate division KSB1 bacterium]|nr:xanthine dehydrogenase family protein molybdopterin-binding subunit [candidate division KSB1 bacterium]